jgi:hypothetical protein
MQLRFTSFRFAAHLPCPHPSPGVNSFVMRFVVAGLITLLAISNACFAQVKGEVESIGFGSIYRSNCWTPMVVRVQAEKSGIYQIRVKQDDLDRDLPEFAETVSLTGSDEGNNQPQRFWTYFIPQPTDSGLTDTTRGGTLRELQEQLRVFICDEKGKELAQLPVTNQITNIENYPGGATNAVRGNRLVVAVLESGQPTWTDYKQSIGTMEDVVMMGVRPGELPEDVRGYQAVDAVLWLRAPALDPAKPSDERRYRAIQQYVRQGGKLVICQPTQREAVEPWGEMLPVNIQEMVDRTQTQPLFSIAMRDGDAVVESNLDKKTVTDRNSWRSVQGPFKVARADAKPGTLVDTVIHWDPSKPNDVSPYIVRQPFGAGCVTWIAQDLSDPGFARVGGKIGTLPGWPHIWDHVFDWKNDTLVINNETSEVQKDFYKVNTRKDLGGALDGLMELNSKSRTLVLIAVLFFIAYWLVAGPGVYFFLSSKGRSHISWFMFGASAIIATALTVLVVKLVVRGDPELAHVTVIRQAAGQPAFVMSRFGLYIPQDGPQEIALRETSPGNVSFISAFPLHPGQHSSDNQFPAQLPYDVPIREAAADAPAAVTIPYRSTLKKLNVHWVGNLPGGLDGAPSLIVSDHRSTLRGKLGNRTGKELKNVYIAFRDVKSEHADEDQLLFLPKWEKDRVIDLQKEFFEDRVKFADVAANSFSATPDDRVKLQNTIGTPGIDKGWVRFFYSDPMRAKGFSDETWNDRDGSQRRSFPMLCFFDRLPTMKNFGNGDRVDLLRRGARQFDVSNAVCAGQLVICAEAEGEQPLPYPLEVNNKRVEGKGTLFYQFMLPLERSRNALMTTQPSILGRAHGVDRGSVTLNTARETNTWRP